MFTKQSLWTAFLCLGLGLACATATYAQDPPDKDATLSRFDNQIRRLATQVKAWETHADIAFTLGLIVMLLGVAGAGAGNATPNGEEQGAGGGRANRPKPKKPWARRAVIAAGILVTVVTAVREYRFPGDPKDLRKFAGQGHKIVDALEDIKDRFKSSTRQEELDQLAAEFASNVSKFESILEKLDAVNFGILDGTVVYADASGPPAWIRQLPADGRFVQVVGRGEAPDLAAAERAARADGFRQLGAQVVAKSSVVQATQRGAANDYAASQAETVSRYFEFDNARRIYRYYVWLRLSKAIADPVYLPRSRLQNTMRVQVPASGTTRVTVPLTAPDPADGSFVFTLLVTRAGDGVVLELSEIETIQDGSVFATPWYFDVSVDGTPRISVPERRYDDARRVTRVEQRATISPVRGSTMAISVSGYKPKDFK